MRYSTLLNRRQTIHEQSDYKMVPYQFALEKRVLFSFRVSFGSKEQN